MNYNKELATIKELYSQVCDHQSEEEIEEDMKPLPKPVRIEMERAIKIHEKSGNLEALRAYAFVYEFLVERWFPRIMWGAFFLSILLTFSN